MMYCVKVLILIANWIKGHFCKSYLVLHFKDETRAMTLIQSLFWPSCVLKFTIYFIETSLFRQNVYTEASHRGSVFMPHITDMALHLPLRRRPIHVAQIYTFNYEKPQDNMQGSLVTVAEWLSALCLFSESTHAVWFYLTVILLWF